MWFKNLRIYSLTSPFKHTPESLEKKLKAYAFHPCGSLDPVKYGWSYPLGRQGQQYVHTTNNYLMICAKKQEKIIPAAVVNEALEERVLEIQNQESRHIGRKEKQTLKDEVIFSLMPKALAKSSFDYAYIAPHKNYLVVNASSSGRAELLLSALREALGELKIVPLAVNTPITQRLTDWLRNSETIPQIFSLDGECELKDNKHERVIRCKNFELTTDEIMALLDSGMHVNKLALVWNDAIRFVLDEQLAFKRLKFEDKILEQLDDYSAESAAEQFDIDFSIMTTELAALIESVITGFDGLADTHF